MAVTPAQLLDPVGPVQPGLFPKDNPDALTARLQGYIAQGVTATAVMADGAARDRVVWWYAIYRVWDAVYSMLIARPAVINQQGHQTTEYTKDQLEAARLARDEAYLNYTNALAGATATVRNTVVGSLTLPNQYVH